MRTLAIKKPRRRPSANRSKPAPTHGNVGKILLFALNFLKKPKSVGGPLPSSRCLVDQVLKQVDWERAQAIVEYGPGLGAFTGRVLERMRPDAKLITLEINGEFIRYLNRSIRDPRLHLVQESATNIDAVLKRFGISQADYVISGIPFSALPATLRDTIVRKTYWALRPAGRFLVYQCSSAVLPHLKRVFPQVACEYQLLNFLPSQLFFCDR